MKKKILTGLAVAGVLLLTGCASASTDADMTAVHYEGGSFSAKKFKDCLDPSKRSGYDPGDKFYQYPTRQISYDATGGKDAESAAFDVVSKDNAELSVPVTVTFDLITDCDTLRKFHENVGAKYKAYFTSGHSDDWPSGWIKLLNFVIGKPLDTTLDRISQQYDWRHLWNDPTTKADMETQVNQSIQALVDRQAGGHYFENFSVLIEKPEPTNEALVQAIADEQSGIAQAAADKAKAEADAQAATAKAKADEITAQSQVKLAQAQAKTQQAEIDGYGGIENYLKHELISQGGNPYQPSYGTALTPAQ